MDAGSDVVLTFTGTSVRWIGLKDPWSGQADVFVDGQLKGRIDT
jgi:hypothetical protein